jgi:GntR family transcriptional regulator
MAGDDVSQQPPLDARLRRIWLRTVESGEPFPGEPALALRLGASRPAVREALIRLEYEGLIGKRKGAETTVNRAAVEIPARFDQQIEKADLIRAMGGTASLEVLDSAVVSLGEEEAVALELDPGAAALRVTKRWRADGLAVVVAIDTVPLRDGTIPDGVDIGASLFDLVRKLGHERVAWELAWPSAANLDARTASWLERPEGEAVLTMELTGVSRNGIRVYRAFEYHYPQAFRYGLIRLVPRHLDLGRGRGVRKWEEHAVPRDRPAALG